MVAGTGAGARLARDAQQRLWAVDVDGQVLHDGDDGGGLRPLPTPALSAARSLLGDRDGNLWLGSNVHGLLRIARSRIGLRNDAQQGAAARRATGRG
ncbi:hypothetical protein KHF85_09515 [Xanthomonas translucens pv. graminis]|uniref:two-component regulator propeller domain-containing protein n=1 Tax=Xanthomonas graminis TaxID=3390026 RepID=UPI002541155D|nr:two-component regulator propeller domain-containing protein [Xanthomonas translucens]WIH06598.1 hypothetical protein KHF85_09515 [Xanthomonas translucens pv. graminis]